MSELMSSQYWQDPDQPLETAVATPQRAPGALTAIAVICLLFGGYGLYKASTSFAGMLLSVDANALIDSGASGMEAELMERIMATYESKRAAFLFAEMVHFGTAGGLLVGGILLLKRARNGRSFLAAAMVWAILYELGASGLQFLQLREISLLMKDLGDFGGDPEAAAMVGRIVGVIGMLSIGFFLFIKCGFYLWGTFYLRQASVRAYFGDLNQDGDTSFSIPESGSQFGSDLNPGFAEKYGLPTGQPLGSGAATDAQETLAGGVGGR